MSVFHPLRTLQRNAKPQGMPPWSKRLLTIGGVTLFCLPLAVLYLGLSQFGDCFDDAAVCEAGKQRAFWLTAAFFAAFYALMLWSFLRKR